MSNALYVKAKEAFLAGDIDWIADTIKLVLVDTADYAVNLATHDFLDDVPGAARVATSGAFTGKTVTDGAADADDVTLASVTGDISEAIVIYQDTGVEATSRLIAYFDTATGLAVTPAGTNITIVWDAGTNRIFHL